MKNANTAAHQSSVEALQRRLEMARQAFKDFYVQCFWSYRDDAEITEEKIPFIIRKLRQHDGQAGYRVAAELCRQAISSGKSCGFWPPIEIPTHGQSALIQQRPSSQNIFGTTAKSKGLGLVQGS